MQTSLLSEKHLYDLGRIASDTVDSTSHILPPRKAVLISMSVSCILAHKRQTYLRQLSVSLVLPSDYLQLILHILRVQYRQKLVVEIHRGVL